MTISVGTRLGPYEILQLLGAGGMGQVWRARDTRLGRDVALKVLPERFAHDAERLARFEREARAVAALNHPNIVVLHSIEEVDGVRFLTMELVEGQSLAEFVTPGGLPLERILALGIPLADALASAHEQGVIHRDLKPSNVMVTRTGRVKVLDFGLAKLAADEPSLLGTATPTISSPLTEAGEALGTAPYMSPEQLRGEPADARSDLFSFGVVLYELATGRRPFAGATRADVTSAILRDRPAPLTSVRSDLSGDLDRIVSRCLEKNPRERFQTALDVANELRRLERGESSGGSPKTQSGKITAGSSRAERGKRGPAALLASAIVLAAIAGAGWFVTHRATAPPATPATPSARRSVAVLEFENLTGDPSLDWMKRGVSELLSSALTQSSELDVFDAQRIGELAETEHSAAPAATPQYSFLARHGIHTAIAGTILRSGGDLRLQGRIVDTSDGRLLHSYAVEGPADSGLFHLAGRLIPDLQVAMEVSLSGDREAEGWLREITTTSADAYRLYLRGHQALLASRWKEAATAYEQALQLDSTFIAARTELSGAYWNLGDEPHLELTRAAMRRLRPRADQRGQLHIDLLESVVGNDPPMMIQAASELVQLYPENRFYTYLLGKGYYLTKQYRRAIDTLHPLVEQGYSWSWSYVVTARSAEELGDFAKARAAYEKGFQVTHGDPEVGYAFVHFLTAHGDTARRASVIEQALGSPVLAESPVVEGELRLEHAKDLFRRGDESNGRKELVRASALIPKDDEARVEADSMVKRYGLPVSAGLR